ncbi:MAG: PIN domain-containing protein [Anaerolineales bacterium]|nr:PIN domain-containing protein [Anaerolineales bacterium]
MGVLDDFRGSIVGLDTTPLIYFIEKNATYHPLVRPFFVAMAARHFSVVTSTITLVETLVHPLRNNHHELAGRYREILLNTANLTTYDLTPDIAQKAAEIRANYQIRTPDAIQLAAALQGNATFFLTNDLNLKKFTDIKVIVVEDLA